MTREQLEHILREWQRRLRLDHWDIQIRWHLPVDKENEAEIRISDDYEQASIRISQHDEPDSDIPCEGFTSWSARRANEILVHELLHIFEKQTKRPVQAYLPEKANLASELFWTWYEHGAENWVERLSLILVDLAGVVE